MALAADPASDVNTVASSFLVWLGQHEDEVAGLDGHSHGDLGEALAQVQPAMRALYEAGWLRLGWPEWAGGIGGSSVLRAAVLEGLAAAGHVVPEFIATPEIVGPMLVRYAPALAATDLAAALRGDEVWCQGFSEPEAGSDLGSLRTRAVLDGDGFVLSGQKMWSSFGHVSRRCSLLARTGGPDSGYRGLTMFWLDLESPGVTVVPTACASGRSETSEIFLDDVRLPAGQVVGEVGGGWEAVMYLLQFERGAYAWLRQAEMLTDLGALLGRAAGSPGGADAVGEAYLAMFALRSLAARTVNRLAREEQLGPEISVDKIVLGTTEQTVADTARQLLWPALELEDSADARNWRRAWAFSRITTIYGGAIEVQRDLVSERLLGLPRGR
jgi:alkylation response protein AidB-like acyl-CoA dehydrogenase